MVERRINFLPYYWICFQSSFLIVYLTIYFILFYFFTSAIRLPDIFPISYFHFLGALLSLILFHRILARGWKSTKRMRGGKRSGKEEEAQKRSFSSPLGIREAIFWIHRSNKYRMLWALYVNQRNGEPMSLYVKRHPSTITSHYSVQIQQLELHDRGANPTL